MTTDAPRLHLVAGKIASGKSTLAASLSSKPATILISEDTWLDRLFGEDMRTLRDYVRYSGRLREAMGPHISMLLECGLSVVLDFPANTLENRAWLAGVGKNAGVSAELHYLDVSDEVCLERLHARNQVGGHPFQVSDAQFHQVTKHFIPPREDEGFALVVHTNDTGEL